jgi:BRCT domain type II-containing protein
MSITLIKEKDPPPFHYCFCFMVDEMKWRESAKNLAHLYPVYNSNSVSVKTRVLVLGEMR